MNSHDGGVSLQAWTGEVSAVFRGSHYAIKVYCSGAPRGLSVDGRASVALSSIVNEGEDTVATG